MAFWEDACATAKANMIGDAMSADEDKMKNGKKNSRIVNGKKSKYRLEKSSKSTVKIYKD